jgi:diguanylate cyclase (GGDEF)-like protein/PAS domain S-box-containing protein
MSRRPSSRISSSRHPKHSSVLRLGSPEANAKRHTLELLELLQKQAFAIVDSSNDAIFANTLEGVIVSWNRAAERIYGYSAPEIIGKSATILSPPELRDELAEILQVMKTGKRVDPYDTAAIKDDGTRIGVSISISPILDARGKILGASAIARDISEQKKAEESIRRLASHDALTDLANYRTLMEALHAELKRSDRTGRPFALLLLDVDRLKAINDKYGHLVGSRALCRLAAILKRTCRSIDTAARYGGDEFAVLLVETNEAIAMQVSQRISGMLANDGENPPFAISAGVAVYPKDGFDIESLFVVADRMLYKNKLRGDVHDVRELRASC